jgi:hypothetical protein
VSEDYSLYCLLSTFYYCLLSTLYCLLLTTVYCLLSTLFLLCSGLVSAGILYGMGIPLLAQKLGVDTKEASGLMRSFKAKYPNIKRWEQHVRLLPLPIHRSSIAAAAAAAAALRTVIYIVRVCHHCIPNGARTHLTFVLPVGCLAWLMGCFADTDSCTSVFRGAYLVPSASSSS